MLAGAGLGDHPPLVHSRGQERLTEHVVDLVRAGVTEVLALEVDARAAALLAEPLGEVERRRTAGVVLEQAGEAALELAIALGRRPGLLELDQRRHERLGDEAPAEAAEVSARVRKGPLHRAPLASATNRHTLSGSLRPGCASTPEFTSTAYGMRGRDRSGDVLGREAGRQDDPPPRIRQVARDRPLDRLSRLALAPARGAVEQERGRVLAILQELRARRERLHSAEIIRRRRELDRLDHRHRVAFEVLRLLVAVELQGAEAACIHDRLDMTGRVIPEDADRRHERRQRANDRGHLRGRHESRRVLDEDEAERVGAGVDRRLRVLEVGDAADLDSGHC